MARVKADLRRSVLQSARSNRRQAQDRKRGHYIGTINKVLLKRALLMVISGTELEGVGGSWRELEGVGRSWKELDGVERS